MALEYTEEKRNSLDKETIIQLFLMQQEQLRQIDHHLQLVQEQLSDLKRHRTGIPFKREPRIPIPGGGSDERQIRQRRPALPAGAGVRSVRPAYFQTEHGELYDPVRREISCGPL